MTTEKQEEKYFWNKTCIKFSYEKVSKNTGIRLYPFNDDHQPDPKTETCRHQQSKNLFYFSSLCSTKDHAGVKPKKMNKKKKNKKNYENLRE